MTTAAIVLNAIAVNEWNKKSRELMAARRSPETVRLHILDTSYTKIRLGFRALESNRDRLLSKGRDHFSPIQLA